MLRVAPASKSSGVLVRSALPLMLKLALSVSPVPVTSAKVKESPTSASVAASEPTVVLTAAFSATVSAAVTGIALMRIRSKVQPAPPKA